VPGPLPLHARIEQARHHPKLQRFAYIDPDGTTRCKCCGVPVAGWLAVGPPRSVQVQDDRRTVLQETPVSIQPLANYANLIFTMDDGGEHASPCCGGCTDILQDPSLWDAWYAADLARMAELGPTSGLAPERVASLLGRWATRRPIAARMIRAGEG
jgi:hypothetical protein